MYLKQFYKSNIEQLKLFCPVLHFLANQAHEFRQWRLDQRRENNADVVGGRW